MTNKEKFLALVAKEKTNTLAKNEARIKDRAMLRASQNIAWAVLNKLDELNWTQKILADKMDVTPQQIQKIVKGRENLTLETIVKLESILDISILVKAENKTSITTIVMDSIKSVLSSNNNTYPDYKIFVQTERTNYQLAK
jgi:ribosome-binding protein aMBF1 (putative translation factor)